MADAKLFTELAHALLYGIKTSNPRALDKLYESKDEVDSFPEEDALSARITDALTFIASLSEIHGGPLMKQFQFYTLMLAVMYYQNPLPTLNVTAEAVNEAIDREKIVGNLSLLADVAELGEDYLDGAEDEEDADDQPLVADELNVGAAGDYYSDFVQASVAGTNTETSRTVRFRYFYEALTTPRTL